MLEGLRGSSVLYSNNFDKEEYFYLKSDFINHLYHYHKHGGLTSIIIKHLSELFFSLSSFISITFLAFFVDYDILLTLNKVDSPITFDKMLHIPSIQDIPAFYLVFSIVFGVYLVIKLIKSFDVFLLNYRIKKFLITKLNDSENEICSISWKELLIKLQIIYNNRNINPYTIASRIQISDNILLGLFNEEFFPYSYISSLLEWNLIYCIINPLFKKGMNLNHTFILHSEGINDVLRRRLRVISVINFLFMPVILFFSTFTRITKLGQKIYQKPSNLITNKWTRYCSWHKRAYNELDIDFNMRKRNSLEYMKNYNYIFRNYMLIGVSLFIEHILNHIFCILIIFTILNPTFLFHVYFVGDRNIFWIIGILGTMITILRNYKKVEMEEGPHYYLEECSKNGIVFTETEQQTAHKDSTQKYVNRLFLPEIIDFGYSFMYTALTPFHLWNISYDINAITYFIRHNIIQHPLLGYVMKYTIFEEMDMIQIQPKTIESYNIFKKKYEIENI
jgi:hypothetical protein